MSRCVPLAALILLAVPAERARAEVIPFLPRAVGIALPDVSDDPLAETDPGVSLLYVIRPPHDPLPIRRTSPSEIIPWFSDPDNAPFADWSVPDAQVPVNPIVQASAVVPVSGAPPAYPNTAAAPSPGRGGSGGAYTVGPGTIGSYSPAPTLGNYGSGWGNAWGYGNGWGNSLWGFGNGFQNQFGGGATNTGGNNTAFPQPGNTRRTRTPTRPSTEEPSDSNDPNDPNAANPNVDQTGVLAASGITSLGFSPNTAALTVAGDGVEGLEEFAPALAFARRARSAELIAPAGLRLPGVGPAEVTPEPATLAVFGLLAVGGGLYARRRKLAAI